MLRSSTVPITRVDDGNSRQDDDRVVIEEPLEIRAGDRPLSVTMRTPGDDFDLATGFLRTEGVVKRAEEIESIRHWGSPNVVRVELVPGKAVDWARLQRNFYTSSSCGVCGKTSIDAVRMQIGRLPAAPAIEREVLLALPAALRRAQPTFDETGGIHAAGIFTATGDLVVAREDVGRHNAVDKAIGALLRASSSGGTIGADASILAVTSRVSFELVQKAGMAGIPVIVAVGAPTSLAIELARDLGVMLIAFVRDGRMNVYVTP